MKPELHVVAGRPVTIRNESPAVTAARKKFGRGFSHEPDGNFLRHPELVLTRWGRGAWYYNTDPHLPVPATLVAYFPRAK